MKISEVTIQDLMEYAKEDNTDLPDVVKAFNIILPACKAFIKGYTGLSDEQLDAKEDLTAVLHALATEMYENRVFTVDKDKVNPTFLNILNMYSINLL